MTSILNLTETQNNQFGLQFSQFVDINKVEHRFPEDLKGCGFSVTLLHNHHHCPTDFVLVYQKDYSEAVYLSKAEA